MRNQFAELDLDNCGYVTWTPEILKSVAPEHMHTWDEVEQYSLSSGFAENGGATAVERRWNGADARSPFTIY